MLPNTKNPCLCLMSILLTQMLPLTMQEATRASGCSKFFIRCSCGWRSGRESDSSSRGCRFDSLPLRIPHLCENICPEKNCLMFLLRLSSYGKTNFSFVHAYEPGAPPQSNQTTQSTFWILFAYLLSNWATATSRLLTYMYMGDQTCQM